MIELDLSKYDLPKRYNRNGNEYIVDKVRSFLRPATREEAVRQLSIDYLHDELNIPLNAMGTEEPVAHYVKYNRKRMDIVVYGENNNNREILMVIECKADHLALSDDVYDQAKEYAKLVNIPVIMITNGREADFLLREDKDTYKRLINPPNYKELIDLKMDTQEIEEFSYDRWDYEDLFDESVYEIELTLGNHINYTLDKKLAPYVINIAEALLDTTHNLTDLPFNTCKFIQDEGISLKKFETPNPNGNFTNYYRSFTLEYKNQIQVISMGVTLTGGKHPHTSIMIAIADEKSKHNVSFFYQLDNYMKIKDDIIYLNHYAKVGTGRCGSIGKDKVINYVTKNSQLNVSKTGVILGKIDASKLLYVDDKQFKDFLANLIEYTFIREEIKELRRQGEI